MNILIVDTDASRRTELQEFLRQGGYSVAGFADGASALMGLAEARPDVVIAEAVPGEREGTDVFRKIRTSGPMSQPYLIAIRRPDAPASPGTDNGTWDLDADDVLSHPIRVEEVTTRLWVARRTLERRRDEAAQIKRISRIPADSPHPIVELTAGGVLIHANLASIPLLETWGWVAGRPAPSPLRHLAASARKQGRPKRAEVACGEQTYSFMAVGLDGGDVCLYGHNVSDLPALQPEPDTCRASVVGHTTRDALTALPTQALLANRLGQALKHARITGTLVALVKVNIDNCADINDAYGHNVGDQLIVLVGESLRDEVRVGDSVLRDNGDGFLLVLQGIGSRETAGVTCSRFIRAAQQAGEDAEIGVRFTLSMGFALFPDDADSEQALVERAEQALTEAKNSGRNCWRDYPAAVGANPMIGAVRLLPRLMGALQTRQLHAQYQPIIAASTGAVAGFEALVRWHDQDLGWISPDRFIPIAEARGLIAEVGRQMADMVFQQLSVWRKAGHLVTVSLNVSKRQLWEPSFAEAMHQLAIERQLAPGWIIMEATERQSLLHDRVCRDTLERLAAAGFRLSIDDFGSGHSTFDVVTDLPFHELKINMSLSRKAQSPRGRHVVKAILGMCDNLGLESVAEGIEDAALGAILQEIGTDKLQGYFYSPPLSAEASLQFLQRHPRQPAPVPASDKG